MSDTVHNGDLAEYAGKVKALAGRLVARWVKPANLKRLGGG